MLAQILVVFGAVLWGFLGTIHIFCTLFTNKLEPRDPATIAAMKATSPVLTRRTNLWNGWIGFNAGFGLGLLLFGTTYLLLAVGHMSLLHDSLALTWLPVAGGAAQLAIAGRYFFPQAIYRCRCRDSVFSGSRTRAFVLRDALDATQLELPGPLDAVLLSLSYSVMPDPTGGSGGAWKYLRPGKSLVIMDGKRHEESSLAVSHDPG